MSRWLVTGGAGFIGSNLVKDLLADGHTVTILDDLSTGRSSNIVPFLNNSNFKFILGDVRDYNLVTTAIKDKDFVVHLAAIPSVSRSLKSPILTTSVNVLGTLNVLEASARIGITKLVVASSSSVYGDTSGIKKETDIPAPCSPYAVSKLAAEEYCFCYKRLYSLPPYLILRFFNVFGPNQDPNSQYSAVIPKFISLLKNGEVVGIFGDGQQTRDFTYVSNVVNAIKIAAFSSIEPDIFNIAAGAPKSVLYLLKSLELLMHKKAKVNFMSARVGEVKDSCASLKKSKDILGYCSAVSFEKGLELTLASLE